MRSPRSKIVTLSAAGSALAVVLVAGIVLERPARERWYISRLESTEVETRRDAADRLGAVGSVNAIPYLLRAFPVSESGGALFAAMEALYVQKRSRVTLISSLGLSNRITTRSSRSRQARVQLNALRNRSVVLDSKIEELTRQVLNDEASRALVMIASHSDALALRRLTEGLASPRWETRWLAVHVLGETDSEEATDAIRSMIADESEHVRSAAEAALRKRKASAGDGGAGTVQQPARSRRRPRF